ncbi:ABC transporter permease [Saccharopolyspora sp. K220]|uniref:ABC transporter permease n=1 Tax=Saccharopolyspora soli TaxID=2926618 RepID=UPI001F5A44FF|nr:ABC transporter permease [Saccharopolyspora soli]MCI2416407.1 ABC transporter permease [Saccharopolyspora soli]
MFQLVVRRLAAMVPLLLLVSLIVFGLVLLVPGDPAITIAGENATEAQIAATRERLGLNDSLLVQYWRWVSNAVQGDLGTSMFSNRSVSGAIAERLPATVSLTALAIALALLISVPAAIVAATNRGGWLDRLLTVGTSVGVAMPNFWLGLLLATSLALHLDLLPATGYVPLDDDPIDWFAHLLLPSCTLGLAAAAELTRQLRGSLIDVFDQDYLRTARAKGLRTTSVIGKHALKNAATPVVTVLGMRISVLLGGTVVVEQIFGIPGLGQLAITAVLQRDLPMVQGIVVVTAVMVLLANLAVDLSYGYLNPKVRAQ